MSRSVTILKHKPSKASPHVIETLHAECHYSNETLAWQHQRRWTRFLKTQGLKLIAQIFDELSKPDEVWRIETLSLNLGVFTPTASSTEWAHRLQQQLRDTLSQQRIHTTQTTTSATHSALYNSHDYALEQFLYYLRHGHLAWAQQPVSTPNLADWLKQLAQRTGQKLWELLQQVLPEAQTLTRLSHIAPYHGLQALIALRHTELAEGLHLLDEQLLRPLQARGRLSAYQVQQIQQTWRVAGLETLWGQNSSTLSADRLRSLLRALTLALSRNLGQNWQSAIADLPAYTNLLSATRSPSTSTDLATTLLHGIAGPLHTTISARPQADIVLTPHLSRVSHAALSRLQAVMTGKHRLKESTLPHLLEQLASVLGPQLGLQLRLWAQQKSYRQQWLRALTPNALLLLMAYMQAPHSVKKRIAASAAENLRTKYPLTTQQTAQHISNARLEAMRQFALRYRASNSDCMLSLSQIEQLLLDACLRHLSINGSLPQDHVAWRHFWQQTLQPTQTITNSVAAIHTESAQFSHDVELADTESDVGIKKNKGTTQHNDLWIAQLQVLLSVASDDWNTDTRYQLRQCLQQPGMLQHLLQQNTETQRWQLIENYCGSATPVVRKCSAIFAATWVRLAPTQTPAQHSTQHWQCLATSVFAAQTQLTSSALTLSIEQFTNLYATQMTRQLGSTVSLKTIEAETIHMKTTTLGASITETISARNIVEHINIEKHIDVAQHNSLWIAQLQVLLSVASNDWNTDTRYQLRQCLQQPGMLQHWLQQNTETQRWQLIENYCGSATPVVRKCSALFAESWNRLASTQTPSQHSSQHWQCLATSVFDAQTQFTSSALTLSVEQLANRYATQMAQQLDDTVSRETIINNILPYRHAPQQSAAESHVENIHISAQTEIETDSDLTAHLYQALLLAQEALSMESATLHTSDTSTTDALQVIEQWLKLDIQQWQPTLREQVSNLLAQEDVCTHWLQQHNIEQRELLLARQFAADADGLLPLHNALQTALLSLHTQLTATQREQLHWHILCRHLFIEAHQSSPELLARRYAMHLRQLDVAQAGAQAVSFQRWRHRVAQALTARQTLAHDTTLNATTAAAVQAALNRPSTLAEQWEARLPRNPLRPSTAVNHTTQRLIPSTSTDNANTTVNEPIYVYNAGIVLLSVYVQRLFSGMQLLDGSAFIDKQTRARAIHALDFLSYGHYREEPSWILNKLLCGVPLSEPVPPYDGLPADHEAMMEGLLSAVISHWKTLGATTPAGLRDTFLQREGRLIRKRGEQGEHWQLNVAQGPFDILLDRLPWSYKTIKLPWMDGVLYVEWR